jgi:rubredoxin
MSGEAGDSAVNWRRTDDGVELYDEANPDAWIHMDVEPGAPAEERPFSVCPECGVVAPQRTAPGPHMVCGECGAEFETGTTNARALADDGNRAADDT